MNTEEIDFDSIESVVSNADCYGDSGNEGAEFPFVIVGCSETYVPGLLMVGCQ